MRRALACLTLLLLPALAPAGEIGWDARGEPKEVCEGMQRTVRYMYNLRQAGATESYAEIKAHMRQVLTDKGDPETRLRGAYEAILPRIEAGEFSPPNISSGEGQLKARDAAGALCREAMAPR